MDKKHLKNDFSNLFSPIPQIISAYLFGSMAKNMMREESDVDIAIYLEDSTSAEVINDIRFEIMDILENYFHRNVDVVILNNASLKLVHQVLKNGILIFASDPNRAEGFALKKQKEYFDFKYYIDKDIKEMKSFYIRF